MCAWLDGVEREDDQLIGLFGWWSVGTLGGGWAHLLDKHPRNLGSVGRAFVDMLALEMAGWMLECGVLLCE